MVAKKRSGKSEKRSTSSAMNDVLKRQKQSTKAIEKMMKRNIAAEISTKRVSKPKEKSLSDIAVNVAARRRTKSVPKKAKVAPKAKGTGISKKVRRPVLSKKPVSTRKPTTRRPVSKVHRGRRASIEVITLGAGLFKVVGAAVGGLFYVGDVLTRFVSSGVIKAVESVGSGAKSAKEKVTGAVKSAKRGVKIKPQRKKVDESPVSAAMKTASKVTGKVAGGMMTIGSGVGRAAGYVVTGALAAPIDIVNGVIGIGASATGSVSRLLFGAPKSKRSKPEKRRRIPVT